MASREELFKSQSSAGPPALDPQNMIKYQRYLTAYVMRIKGGLSAFLCEVPKGESAKDKETRLARHGAANEAVFSIIMESCAKNVDAELAAVNFEGFWANDLFKFLLDRFAVKDRQSTQKLVSKFHHLVMKDNESGAKFVDRVKLIVAEIGLQNIKELPTDDSIIAVLKEGIRERMPILHQVVDLTDVTLTRLYSQINNCLENPVKDKLASVSQVIDEDSYQAFINWTAGQEINKNKSRGRVENEHVPAWKKKAFVRQGKGGARRFACWNCDSTDHGARQCPEKLSKEANDKLEGLQSRYPKGQRESNEHKRAKYGGSDDDDEDAGGNRGSSNSRENEANINRRGTLPMPAWFGTSRPAEDTRRVINTNRSSRGAVRTVYEIASNAMEEEVLLMNVDSGANRVIIKKKHLFDKLDCSMKNHLRTADSKHTLRVEGVGEIGRLKDAKFCPSASTDLVAVAKLNDLGYKVSFGDEEAPLVIRSIKSGEIVVMGTRVNDLYWITVENFLDLVKQEKKSKVIQEVKQFAGMVSTDKKRKSNSQNTSSNNVCKNESMLLSDPVVRLTNDIYYGDYSCEFDDCLQGVASLASSNHKDMIGLMHDRTGHAHNNLLVQCEKSLLVTGLKISDKHIRKFISADTPVCDICARSKLTRTIFNKTHKIRGKELGDYVSTDVAVFINCPSREGYKYVVGFTDHATKFCWIYPMSERSQFYSKLCDFNDIKLKVYDKRIRHYHADGGKELICKEVLNKLKLIGATYSWSPAETPELNGTSERKFRTLGERCLSMMLRAGLPTDFWWDAYETSNYITNRLPTRTKNGFKTPFEELNKQIPDLSHLRIWGCKAYFKLPLAYLRKDFRDKSYVGYFVGYSEEGEIGYKIIVPELNNAIVIGVHVLFNEVIPTYTEEYYQEFKKLAFETVEEESTVESFEYLRGMMYVDDENGLEYINTRVGEWKGHIVIWRAAVNAAGRPGNEEKAPIHVADVVRMMGGNHDEGGHPETDRYSRKESDASSSRGRIEREVATVASRRSERQKAKEADSHEDRTPRGPQQEEWQFDATELGVQNVEHLGVTSDKRVRIPRKLNNMSVLGGGGDVNLIMEGGVACIATGVSDPEEYTPVGFEDAVRSKKWRESMAAERAALEKRGCWEEI